eukprot:403335989
MFLNLNQYLLLASLNLFQIAYSHDFFTKENLQSGLSEHFVNWLNDSGYEPYGFNRSDLFGGSFGGKVDDDDKIINQPVIFIHGNGDLAAGPEEQDQAGFKYSAAYFLEKGYKMSELYGTTWGFGDIPHEGQHFHNKEQLLYLRKFVEAVLEYTGAAKIDVVSHSMGVTFSRRILKGGMILSLGNPFYLGEPLTHRVDSFVGIAGPNWGLLACSLYLTQSFKCCNDKSGFFPGTSGGNPYPMNMSSYLEELNKDTNKEGEHTFSIISLYDMTVTPYVYDRYTSEFPMQDGSYKFDDANYTHVTVKDYTYEMQYNLVTIHKFFPNTTQSDLILLTNSSSNINPQYLSGVIAHESYGTLQIQQSHRDQLFLK